MTTIEDFDDSLLGLLFSFCMPEKFGFLWAQTCSRWRKVALVASGGCVHTPPMSFLAENPSLLGWWLTGPKSFRARWEGTTEIAAKGSPAAVANYVAQGHACPFLCSALSQRGGEAREAAFRYGCLCSRNTIARALAANDPACLAIAVKRGRRLTKRHYQAFLRLDNLRYLEALTGAGVHLRRDLAALCVEAGAETCLSFVREHELQ